LQRIDQGFTAPVRPVQAVEVFTLDQKQGNTPAIVFDPDTGQIATAAKQIRASKNIRDFKLLDRQKDHLLSSLDCFFQGDSIRKRNGFKGL
jgi:hypothetical protein